MAPTRSLTGRSGAAQDRLVGRVLGGRYRVMSRLGEGGMGTVYLCEHAVLGRRYAVKVLRTDLSDDPELVERFRNEAIAASRIGGDNVVEVLDFGEDDGAYYYVMEALAGRSLASVILEDGPLEVARALALLDQICRALSAAHARGVVHRDVKPDNVFVERRADGAERAKVIDFGISQVTPEAGKGRLTRVGEIIGTPEYMAPEQAAGEVIDHRADVYALGVLAYEMLTGELPILARTPIATLVALQTRTPDPPSWRRPAVPAAVDALVLRALAKKPEDRFQSMDAFSRAIAAVTGADRPAAPAPASRPRPETVALAAAPRSRRLLRPGTALGLAAVLVAAVAIGLSWWRAARAIPTATSVHAERPSPAPSAGRAQPDPSRRAQDERSETAAAERPSAPVHPERPSTPVRPERPSTPVRPERSAEAEASARSRRAQDARTKTAGAKPVHPERPPAPVHPERPPAPVHPERSAEAEASARSRRALVAPQPVGEHEDDPYAAGALKADPFR